MRTVPLRRLVASVDNGSWGGDPDSADVNALCVRAADFAFQSLRVSLERAPRRGFDTKTVTRLALLPGDIVLEKSGGGDAAPVGRAVLFQHDDVLAVTSNFAARVRPAMNIDPRFLVYVMQSLYGSGATLRCIKQTTGIQNLDTDAWLNSAAPCPPPEIQRRIADFLDQVADRIDRTIAARRDQIVYVGSVFEADWNEMSLDLERRFGLAPLRRFLVSIVDGPFGSSLTSSHYSDSGTRVIRLGNIGVARFKDGDRAFIPTDYAAKLRVHSAHPGDLVMAGLGDETWPLGRCAVVPDGIGAAVVKADCYRIRLDTRINHDFAAAYLSSPPARARTSLLARGATRARLNTDVARGAELAPADAESQRKYVLAVTSGMLRQQQLRTELARSIDLLTEYKSSLITAAVTGELDVATAGSGIPV